jgi:hypothetical protein
VVGIVDSHTHIYTFSFCIYRKIKNTNCVRSQSRMRNVRGDGSCRKKGVRHPPRRGPTPNHNQSAVTYEHPRIQSANVMEKM